jgi:ubiquinone/menaquinone biosynthesis C-methylase UbiE
MSSRATAATTTDPVFSKLRSDINDRQIAIFLGAGISAALAESCAIDGFNLASWGGLLTHGARWAQNWGGKDENFYKSVELDVHGDTNSMLAAADKVSTALKERNEYSRWLRASVGKLQYSSQAADLASHLKTFAGRQILLVTTNYDSLLEQATKLDAITWQDREKLYMELTNRLPDRPSKIIHLHGYYESPDSVVLGIRDYLSLLGDKFLAALRTVLGFTKSLLFVGFGKGLDDPHFSQFISLTQEVIGNGDQRIYRLCLENEQAELLKQNMGTPVVYGDDFKLLPDFLSKLLRDDPELGSRRRADAEGQGAGSEVAPVAAPATDRTFPDPSKPESRPLMPKCVVLVGRYGTDEARRRTLQVAQEHLQPACLAAKYFAFDQFQDEDLYDASMSPLLHAPMAIAYLGRKAWSSDILAKVGFRLATGKPLVLVFERGEDFGRGPAFEALQKVMKLRDMGTISVAASDLGDERMRATVNNQITQELQDQSRKYFGPRPIHPMAVMQIDTKKDETEADEYIDATDSAFALLTGDQYLLGRRGVDIVHNLQPRIEPEQWPYFSREQDRLYKLFVNDTSGTLDSLTPTARIPLVYKQPVNGVTKAILPIVTHHATGNGIHHMEVLHLDVTASMIRMADGHYELVSPRGVDEVTCAALAEDRWFYSPAPSLEIREGLIVDTNLICRMLLDAADGSLHGQPVASLLARLSLDDEDLGFGSPQTQFELDSVKARLQLFDFSSKAFGKISCRSVTRPLINLVSGHSVGMSWDWGIKETEHDFRSAFREQLTAALKWDVYAANYDRVLPLCDYYSDTVTRHVSYLSPPQAEGIEKVCDIGAGTGNVSLQLLEQGCQVTAVDLSWSMLRHLQAKTTSDYRPRLRILQQSAEKLSQLASGEFDAVTVMMALYGMGQPANALDECIRILKPGGKLVITEPTSQLDVEVIIKGGQACLKKKGLLEPLADPWQRVQEAGRWLKETIRFRIEEVEAVLAKNHFSMQQKIPSHFDQCATIVATKQR